MRQGRMRAHLELCAKDPLWWLLQICIYSGLAFNICEALGFEMPFNWGGWLCIATGLTVLASCVRKRDIGSCEEAPIERCAILGALALIVCCFGVDVLLM